jgi:hypothetical protein
MENSVADLNLTWPIKSNREVEFYGVNWSRRLAQLTPNETITTSQFSVISGGVTIASQGLADALSYVKLSGGTAGLTAELYLIVTTSSGRTWDANVKLPIVDRDG